MANINVTYKGLTGLHNVLTIDNGQTFAQLRTAIISDETLLAAYYGRVSITVNGTFFDSTDNASTTLATAGLVTGSIVTVATARPQASKQVQQEMTLKIAQLKKKAGGEEEAETAVNAIRRFFVYHPPPVTAAMSVGSDYCAPLFCFVLYGPICCGTPSFLLSCFMSNDDVE